MYADAGLTCLFCFLFMDCPSQSIVAMVAWKDAVIRDQSLCLSGVLPTIHTFYMVSRQKVAGVILNMTLPIEIETLLRCRLYLKSR